MASSHSAIAQRVNGKLFQAVCHGAPVRVGGYLSEADDHWKLRTTDGADLTVTSRVTLEPYVSKTSFVEVVGKKAGDKHLEFESVSVLGDADTELWNEHVHLMHLPALRGLFVPAALSEGTRK